MGPTGKSGNVPSRPVDGGYSPGPPPTSSERQLDSMTELNQAKARFFNTLSDVANRLTDAIIKKIESDETGE